jgi:hypothetical protein
MCKHTTAANRTCAFGRGSDMYVVGQAQPQVCGHVAVQCRLGLNPAGPPTGRHCVPNSRHSCMRLTPCATALQHPLNVELETCSNVGLIVVAATYSFFGLLGPQLGTFGRLGLSRWSVHARGRDVSRSRRCCCGQRHVT